MEYLNFSTREIYIFLRKAFHIIQSSVDGKRSICVLLDQQLCQGYIIAIHIEEINLFNKCMAWTRNYYH